MRFFNARGMSFVISSRTAPDKAFVHASRSALGVTVA
jgi:hypothetical protein